MNGNKKETLDVEKRHEILWTINTDADFRVIFTTSRSRHVHFPANGFPPQKCMLEITINLTREASEMFTPLPSAADEHWLSHLRFQSSYRSLRGLQSRSRYYSPIRHGLHLVRMRF